jgi:acyl-CoA dehydrogenase
VHRSGGNANACHASSHHGRWPGHGSEGRSGWLRRWPPVTSAQAFGITEPDASSAARIATRAERDGGVPRRHRPEDVHQPGGAVDAAAGPDRPAAADRAAGLSLSSSTATWRHGGGTRRIACSTTTPGFFFRLLVRKSPDRREGRGFRQVLDGLTPNDAPLASEAIGDGLFFLDRASEYASRREVFGRPIGPNQAVAFPLAQAKARVEAASLLRFKAASLFDAGKPCGAEANMAKLLASQASAEAGNAAMHTFGGNAFTAEYDIERKFRETKLLEIAPVSNNLVLAFSRTFGLPLH